MNQHYTRTLTGFRCNHCSQEFEDRGKFNKHYRPKKGCVPPIRMSLHLKPEVNHFHWA